MTRKTLSRLTTWTIRILTGFIILFGIGLLLLSVLGGTSESHRKGIEEALGTAMNADIELQQLDEFNILPKLTLRAGKIHGVFRDTKNEFMADRFAVGFDFMELASGRNRVAGFDLENFRFAKGATYDMSLESAKIIPGIVPVMSGQGRFRKKPFTFDLPMRGEGDAGDQSFVFDLGKMATGRFGGLSFESVVQDTSPSAGKNSAHGLFDRISVIAGKRPIAIATASRNGGRFMLNVECLSHDMDDDIRRDLEDLATLPFIALDESCVK